MSRTRLATILCLGLAGCATTGSTVPETRGNDPTEQRPANGLPWTPLFPGGPEIVFTVGSPTAPQGPTAFFLRFKPGFDTGWHIHETSYTGIVLAGTLEQPSSDAAAVQRLTAGSYYVQSRAPHSTRCLEGAECVVYIYEEGKFSTTPTTPDGTPVEQRK